METLKKFVRSSLVGSAFVAIALSALGLLALGLRFLGYVIAVVAAGQQASPGDQLGIGFTTAAVVGLVTLFICAISSENDEEYLDD